MSDDYEPIAERHDDEAKIGYVVLGGHYQDDDRVNYDAEPKADNEPGLGPPPPVPPPADGVEDTDRRFG